MARQDVYQKYDAEGNVIDEIRLDEGTPEYEAAKKARESGGGTVGNWYINSGTGHISGPVSIESRANQVINYYTPQIKVNDKGTGLVITGSKEAINNDMASELQTYLDDAFKYADLKSANVADAINKLNESIREQMEQRIVEKGLGMNYDDYKEYQNMMQQFQGTNPMASTAAVPGYTRDGRKIKATDKDAKTIADWLEYYVTEYNAEERATLFKQSAQAAMSGNTDLALLTPFLVMTGGGTKTSPSYGFNEGEKLLYGLSGNLLNEGSAKLIEGLAQNVFVKFPQWFFNQQNLARIDLINEYGHQLMGRDISTDDVKWLSREEFDNKLSNIIGKQLNALTSEEKALLAAASASELNVSNIKKYLSNENGTVTDDVKKYVDYDKYMDAHNRISTTDLFNKEMAKVSSKLASGRSWLQNSVDAASLYAPIESTMGAFAGTLMRMWAEAGIIKYATGGMISPSEISDSIAGKIISLLSGTPKAKSAYDAGLTLSSALNATNAATNPVLKALQTPVGGFLLSAAAELPEDVVQTAIDDVVLARTNDISLLAPTGNTEEDMKKLGESFAQNLAFRLAFTPVHVGYKKIQGWRAAKEAARAAGLDATVSDQLFMKNQQLKDAADTGNIIDLTADSATILNPDGTESVLDNVAMLHFGTDAELQERYPTVAEMVRKKGLVNDVSDSDIAQRIDDAKKAVTEGDYANMSADIIKNINGELVDLTGKPVNVEASDGNVVAYRGQPEGDEGAFIMNDPTNKSEWGDVFFFIENPNYASKFSDNIVYFEFPKEKIVTLSEYADIKNMANNIVGDELEFNKYVVDHGEEAGAILEEISYDNARAVAEYAGKPIVETAWRGDTSGSEYSYFPGVDSEFDESASTHSLSSTNALAPQASTANIEMANRIQKALDTSPYGKSIDEIVSDKYAKSTTEMAEAPSSGSYRWESPDVTKSYDSPEAVFADMPVGKNMTETRQWVENAREYFVGRMNENVMPKFREAYPTIDEQQQFVRNMDYLFDLQRIDGETLESAVGKTFENEGIVYTVSQEDIDFYQNYVEPQMTDLREAGAAGVGREAFTITGYLPHSDYDPMLLTAEDSMQQGMLWREYTGASTTSEDGNFSTGWLNPDLEARYRTFVNNMLWDSLGDQVAVAKYMEEFNADGLNVAANTVEKMVGGRKRLADMVSKSDSAKAVVKYLTKDGELPTDGDIDAAAKKMGATDAVHNLYADIYGSSEGLNQRGNVSLMSKSDWMRSLTTGDGSLYDNGGAMLVNGSADAKFLAKQIFDAVESKQQIDVKQLFTDYLMQNHRRTTKGAQYIAEKWMDKIAQKANNGGVTKRQLVAELSRLIYGEGANRLFRFIGRMDTSKLNGSNRQALDSLLFRHSVLSKVMNSSGFSANINKWTNKLISARMKSLFWMNYKNGVLQASECIRIFTEFKLGDALETIRRLARDKEFRALVDEWVDMLVPERFVKSDSAAATGAMATIADKSSYKNGTLTVEKMSNSELRGLAKQFDDFASSPVELGEAMKNRILVAGILQEAQRKGLSGNELFSYVNQRFERIGLAANEMGRLNASDNPLFRMASNLKTFQIRQASMFLNNINDMNGKKEIASYIIKNLGWKGGLTLIMAKLGYSAASTLGIDPFDLMDDDYTGVDEENYSGMDYFMLSPVAKLLLSGGFTGYINDIYWACRKAYEDNAPIDKQTEERLDKSTMPGMAVPGLSWDNVLDAFSGFIPGYTAGKRVVQMNDLLESGWAVSGTGSKMYEAPNNPFDIATGYVFGRSNTPNARAYYQTPDYLHGLVTGGLQGLGQQIGREISGDFRQFDPVDKTNYSDWFNGTSFDEQQWQSGYYYFLNEANNAQKEYQNSLNSAYSDQDKAALRESFNRKISELENKLNKFTSAYVAKHPEGIDAKKSRNLINILNLYQPVMTDTEEEENERSLDAYGQALYRYAQAGLPAVTSYKRNEDTGKVEPVYSPQYRAALQGEFGLPEEAAAQIRKLYNDKWKELGQQFRNRLFATKGTKAKQAIQKQYIGIIRQDLDPIVEIYGNGIWSNEDVENIIDDVFNSMIPKYGQSAKSYLKNLYKDYTGMIRYTEKGNETLTQINKMLDQGKTAQAKALARALLQRVQENRTSVTREELESLQRILND